MPGFLKNKILVIATLVALSGTALAALPAAIRPVPVPLASAAVDCGNGKTAKTASGCCQTKPRFFLLKPWYEYLPMTGKTVNGQVSCSVNLKLEKAGTWSRLWLIGIVILEDLLRVAGMVAGAFIIVGGIKFMTSRGEPENTKSAINTIVNALIGLAIAIVASAIVAFIGSKLGY